MHQRCFKGQRLERERTKEKGEKRGGEVESTNNALHRTVRSRFDRVFIIDKAAAAASASQR